MYEGISFTQDSWRYPNIVRWLKGISAKELFEKCPELQQSYWKKQKRHLWSPSYYVESIGATNEQAVKKYIDEQRTKEVNLDDPQSS